MWRSYRLGGLKVDSSGSGLRFIIYNNWVMLLLTLVIFVGTLFPFFSGLFTEQKISLKPDYFTKITAPGGLVLLLLLCVCPYLIRYGIGKNWRTIGGIIVAAAALGSWFFMHKLPLAFFIICGFGMVNLVADFISRYIKSRERDKTSAAPLNLRWYGARIVHIGVVLCFIGIAGSGGYDTEKQAALKRDEKINVAGFDITFKGLRADHGSTFTSVTADLSVHRNDKLLRTSEVDIRRTLASDLYVALTQVDNSNELINLNILVKPLINWIWIGSIVSVIGTILVLISFYRRRTTVLQSEEKDV
jgi:cytochrome c-type biogenesis protein CcmF